jgi:hypothetical protein
MEFLQVGVLSNDIWVALECIENNVEKGNCSTCILCVLLHEEKILGNLFRLQTAGLLIFMLILSWGDLKQEHDSQSRFGDHLQRPLFGRHKFLEAELLCLETHLLDELVDDFRI